MSKQYVVETLVCGNCLYASRQNKHTGVLVHCCLHQKRVHVKSPFCMDFRADWVLDDVSRQTTILDTGQVYIMA